MCRNRFLIRMFFVAVLYYLVLAIFAGTFFEEYEAFLSSIVSNEYFSVSPDFIFWDVNGIPVLLLSKLNVFFSGFPLYGLYLNILNLSAFLLLIYTTITVFSKLERNKILLLLLVLFVLMTPNIISISTTRIVFLLFISVIIHYHNTENKYFLSSSLTLLAILRIDAVALSALIYVILNILNRNVKIKIFLPLIISVFYHIVFNSAMQNYASESINAYYYNEIEIFDRSNIAYEAITPVNERKLHYLKEYSIFDTDFFEIQFYEDIKRTIVRSGMLFNSFFDVKLFYNTLLDSKQSFFNSFSVIIIALILLVRAITTIKRGIWANIFLIFIPIIVAFYLKIPQRFIFPYYIFLAFYYIYISIGTIRDKELKMYLIFFSVLVFLNTNDDFERHNELQKKRLQTNTLLDDLQTEINGALVIEDISLYYFDNKATNYIANKHNVCFLNFFYFEAFHNYKEKWGRICNCDPLSIVEKIVFISDNNIPILIRKDKTEAYKNYFLEVHNMGIDFLKIKSKFTEDLYTVRLY